MNAIGGDGFWLIRERGGRVRAIEACGYAGERASIAHYRALELDAVPDPRAEGGADRSRHDRRLDGWRSNSRARSAAGCR